MLKIGITGGIGSGKSTICNIFRILGVPVFNSDLEAKRLMEQQESLVQQIRYNFGESIYNPKGKLDRDRLSKLVFEDPEKLKVLNNLVHPAVFAEFESWLENISHSSIQSVPFIIKEAALMFESKSHLFNDYTVMVAAPENTRILRVQERDGWSESKIKARIQNQLSEEEKTRLSDYIIHNDDHHQVIPQVLVLYRSWTQIK